MMYTFDYRPVASGPVIPLVPGGDIGLPSMEQNLDKTKAKLAECFSRISGSRRIDRQPDLFCAR
jgi:hypothetical protein